MTIEEKIHHEIGGSNCKRVIACPGSVQLSRPIPKQASGPYARHGTAAHHVAEHCLTEDQSPEQWLGRGVEIEGEMVIVDEEMVEGVQLYLNVIAEEIGPFDTMRIEEKVTLDWVAPDLGGTIDCLGIGESIKVVDLKFGKQEVPAEQNEQLMFYAAGAIPKMCSAAMPVVLIIVQPRGIEQVKKWETTVGEIWLWVEEVLRPAVIAARGTNPQLHAGTHCQWCPASPTCLCRMEEAQQSAVADFKGAIGAIPDAPAPEQLSPDQIVRIAAMADWLQEYANSCKAYMQQQAELGVRYPGWKLVQKRSVREWVDEKTAEERLRSALGNNAYEMKLLSVAKAEKALKSAGKEVDVVMQDLVTKPDNGVVLAPASDRRKEVAPPAALDFIDAMEEFKQ